MHRFFLPPDECAGCSLVLGGGEAHHALDVLRLREGERVLVMDGAGREITCAIRERTRGKARMEVISARTEPQPNPRITLIQAVPKGKLIESIIQKATELGVQRVVPVFTERVVSQVGPREARAKQIKWQAVAIEAIKQSGNLWLPTVEAPAKFTDFISQIPGFDLPLVASLQSGSRHLRDYVNAFKTRHQRKPATTCVWIGPEGDFAPCELERIEAAGALPITLGRLVLRTDTASCYCLSILNYEYSSIMN